MAMTKHRIFLLTVCENEEIKNNRIKFDFIKKGWNACKEIKT